MPAAVVQAKVGSPSAGGTIVFTSNVTIGNTIIVLLPWAYNGCPPTPSDNLGNTYTANKTGSKYWIYTAPVTTGGACTVTVAAGCSSAPAAAIIEASGLDASPYDGFSGISGGNTNSANPVVSGSVTPTQNGDLILGLLFASAGTPTFTPEAGWTEAVEASSICVVYQVQGTAGAANPSATASTNAADILGWSAAFKAAAGGGGGGGAKHPVVNSGIVTSLVNGGLVR